MNMTFILRQIRRAATGCALFSALASFAAAPEATRVSTENVNGLTVRERQGLRPSDALLFNGWGVTPAGRHAPISDLALKMLVAPDGKTLVAVCCGYNNTGLAVLDIAGVKVSEFHPLKECWNGLAFSRDGKKIFVSGGDLGEIHIFNFAGGKATFDKSVKPSLDVTPVFLAGIAVHPATGALYVCNEANHEVWVLQPETLALEKIIAVGLHPHSCVFGADKKHLYVSNWGSRTVSAVDTEKGRRLRDITVGLRPNDMALAPDGRLFVACAGDNTVHVITTAKPEKPGPDPSPARRLWEGTREVISTSLYPQSPEGSTPDAVAVSPDGKTLFVANADNNCVMVVDISNALFEQAREHNESVSLVNGFIPTGWYPSAVAVSADNKTLFVANGKGLTSHSNFPAKAAAPVATKNAGNPRFDHIGKTLEGSVSFIERPDASKMAAYTEQVRKNSPYQPEWLMRAPLKSQCVVPDRVGEPCVIKYVLYIIKENRTYDQVLGDMKDAAGRPLGNGEPKLTLYGEKITPNHHAIARDYVLLDNLYCNGEVSVDGHSWCDAAIATDFNQRSWILSYSKHGKLPGNEEMENPANGYLWDLCRRHGVSFMNYGEGAQRVPSANRGRWRADWAGGRDMKLVDFWIEDLRKAEKTGVLPRFTIMSLGENHTKGTTPGAFTPDACVGSNDLGLGKIIEAASRSRFWPEMAIFVIEDDAQNGPDHVDAHRTVGLVISPYVKRHFVDSTLYTTASMIRTMELILGLPPLTQYDAGATPMFNSFTKSAKLAPYNAITPEIDLVAKNTAKSPFAKESARMNFKEYDRAPEDQLNRILWHVAKGMDEPYPTPIHRVLFTQ
ncbi:MAG: bifunctional YncE family protein/alkaline phosphatase family protein [Verrucomicrobia bacterium]|nr:bifunctional YncE family protein/alkaline phosphatase family protein [Verrucomicrobiota bacterium]